MNTGGRGSSKPRLLKSLYGSIYRREELKKQSLSDKLEILTFVSATGGQGFFKRKHRKRERDHVCTSEGGFELLTEEIDGREDSAASPHKLRGATSFAKTKF